MVSTKIITFPNKIGDKQIESIIATFYEYFIKDLSFKNKYIFDFSNVEWIDNQGMLVLTALLKYLVNTNIPFKFHFLKNGSSEETDKRIAKQFIEIWEVWKIYEIVPNQKYMDYFDIDGNSIERLKRRYGIKINNKEIYDRYGITPFITLDKIEKYEDRKIGEMISKIYTLNEATNEILKDNYCYLPFENETISSIITKELYENFLDHFKSSIFSAKNDCAFMSIALKKKISTLGERSDIQNILQRNFEEESMDEIKDFFFDKKNKTYKNESLLQISFLDFGEGIPKSLLSSYEAGNKSVFSESVSTNIDSNIIEYSFMPTSSQHNLHDRYLNSFISPRGLFDLLSIVKRFEGLVVARSNHGKVAFDFSNNNDFSLAVRHFNKHNSFFPGTLITILIPERNLEKRFDNSSIKFLTESAKFKFLKGEANYISLFEIQKNVLQSRFDKEHLYNEVFNEFIDEVKSIDENLIYVDFKGYEIDERITKKIIYYLASDYGVSSSKNIIVINPPPIHFLQSIKDEILNLSTVEKKFKIHPTVFVYIDRVNENLELFWLGVYSENDIDTLNKLLYDTHDLSYIDFENPDDLISHINKYDKHGNLVSVVNSNHILEFYKDKVLQSRNKEIETLIRPNIKKEPNSIFLCNGNYYQYEYLQLFDLLSNLESLKYLARELFQELQIKVLDIGKFIFVGITASSQKIIQSLIDNNYVDGEKCILLNNYFSFEKEQRFIEYFKEGDQVILICDVISTGYMVNKLETQLKKRGANLAHIGVLVDAIDPEFRNIDYKNIKDKLTTIYPFLMNKFERSDISKLLQDKKLNVIRINPLSNTPINQSVIHTNYKKSVLIENEDFLNFIDPKNIKVGYFNFNNLIHPYFFDMQKILTDDNNSKELLKKLFENLGQQISTNEIEIIFYPKNSAIQHLDFDFLKNNVLKNHNIEIYELERFPTNEGWRFSHPPEFLIAKSKDKCVLLLDDGSCSGESILQMIDEVAFLDVRRISVLSIIGRVNEHKREFLSRINSINTTGIKNVDIKIFFGSQWHVPTYFLAKSPVVAERYWLKKLNDFPNTPETIKKISRRVSFELKAKSIDEDNNAHLIQNKDGSNMFGDLIIARDHFGKITDFRFYKEYFHHFDNFISVYESKSRETRGKYPYRLIEVYCGIIIHEPYLFDRIKAVVPDIVEKIQEFVIKIFWAQEVIEWDDLYYTWDKKNLFHLIFIVFKEDNLFDNLTATNLSVLINSYVESQSDLDYILFKLCYYLDINDENRIKDNSISQTEVKTIINTVIENNIIHDWKLIKLKRFRGFISTLRDKSESFKSKIATVKYNYDKITDDKYHSESVSTQFEICIMQIESLNAQYNADSEKAVTVAWNEIDIFLADLLSFTISYPHFLLSFGQSVYDLIEGQEKSLRIIHGKLSDKILKLNRSSNFEEIQSDLIYVLNKFIKSESIYHQIFCNISTNNFFDEYEIFKRNISEKYGVTINETVNCPTNFIVAVPLYMLKKILFEQIESNLRHANVSHSIFIEILNEEDEINLTIKNSKKTKDSIEIGGGMGLNLLKNLNSYPDQLVHYTNQEDDYFFTQQIRIKII
jgi:orotate phosphoribosyltransferase